MDGKSELRSAVGFGTSFREQVRLLWWSRRWVVLWGALLVVLLLSRTASADRFFGGPLVLIAALFAMPVPVLWAVLLWQGETAQRRSYHWSLPVPRAAHDLARIAAGAVYLIAGYLLLAAGGAVAALRGDSWTEFASIGPGWTSFFAGPLVTYVMVSPFVLWSDSVNLRRGLAAFFLLWSASFLVFPRVIEPFLDAFFGFRFGLGPALVGGFWREAETAGPGSEGAAAAVWIAIGIAATCLAAAWRPADLARMLRRTAR